MQLNRNTLLSWEFVSFVLVSLGAWLLDWAGTFSGIEAVYLSAAAAGVTAIARGFAKQGADVKNWWATTEFFVSVIGGGQAVLAQLGGTISGDSLARIAAALAFSLAIARGLAKNPAVAAGLITAEQAAPSATGTTVSRTRKAAVPDKK